MQTMVDLRTGMLILTIASLLPLAAAATVPVLSQALPQSTAIPVRFEHSVDAKTAKMGDAVTAKTMQVVVLPGGSTVTKGSVLVGHVVAAQAFHFDPAPYAHQKPSVLSIHFDTLKAGDEVLPVNVSVRAIASTIDSRDATYPHGLDETDHPGMMTMIGGIQYSPLEKQIRLDGGNVIGYNRKNGVFARLIPSEYSGAGATMRCDGTTTEQSVAIFSPDACGVYGFGGAYMPAGGQDGSGTFTLALPGHTMKLYAGSTALLEVN